MQMRAGPGARGARRGDVDDNHGRIGFEFVRFCGRRGQGNKETEKKEWGLRRYTGDILPKEREGTRVERRSELELVVSKGKRICTFSILDSKGRKTKTRGTRWNIDK